MQLEPKKPGTEGSVYVSRFRVIETNVVNGRKFGRSALGAFAAPRLRFAGRECYVVPVGRRVNLGEILVVQESQDGLHVLSGGKRYPAEWVA